MLRELLPAAVLSGLPATQSGQQWRGERSIHVEYVYGEYGCTTRQLIFPLEKWLPWVCCVALLCFLTLLASFFLLHLSLTCIHVHVC